MKKYIPLLLATVVVSLLFLLLNKNHSEYFERIEKDYKEGVAVNLSGNVNEDKLSEMLVSRGYIESREEADFIAAKLAEGVKKELPLENIHSLKKNAWKISWRDADSLKNSSINLRYEAILADLGLKSPVDVSLLSDTSAVDLGHKDGYAIKVRITEKDSTAGFIAKTFGNDVKGVDSVKVCLRMHRMISLAADEASGIAARDSLASPVIAYAVTGKDGTVTFSGLNPDSSYSVLPMAMGFEYGTAKGTIDGTLKEVAEDGVLELGFTQKELRVTLFGNNTLDHIKSDTALTVRSPEEFKSTLFRNLFIFFAVWWGAVLFLKFRKRKFDTSILSLLMLLTGFCLLNMFSINDPLTDKMLGVDMANGIFIGVALIVLIYNVDFVKFYQGKLKMDFDGPLHCLLWIVKPFRTKVRYLTSWLREGNLLYKTLALLLLVPCLPFIILDLLFITRLYSPIEKWLEKAPKGIGYVLLGIILTMLLFSPLGQAVGGMRVNLNIGILFQPSEITKYLIIIFMAAYFCRYADNIVKYSAEGNTSLFGNKLKSLGWIIAGLGILMVLYMALGDMGPALVLAFTFILMYSIVKSKTDCYDENGKMIFSRVLTSDIAMLLYGVLTFLLALWLGSKMGSLFLGGTIWFVVWILYGLAVRKQIFESPILFNLIIFAFIFGGQLLSSIGPLEDAGKRLESRKAMCTNVWGELGIDGEEAEPGENMQVAQGLWALSSGGFFGQGLASGDPHEIPAFHTDMVLESIGEQMGFVGVLVVVLTLAFLLKRILVAGFRTNHPFAFYLCLGIAIVTAVQFLIIALGSTGMIPLTGVTVPFFSYGKVSMILNLAAMGMVLAISGRSADETTVKNAAVAELNRKNIGKYTYSLSLLIFAYLTMMVVVLGVFFNYQVVSRDTTLVRPLYVKGESGNTMVEYNPRIFKISDKLKPGNIYDRNGVLLATSDYGDLESDDFYTGLGFEKPKEDHRRRYYPFGEHLYFMLGDANTKLFFQAEDNYGVGYVAEYKHLSDLRGYDNTMRDDDDKPVAVRLQDVYRPSKFLSLCDTVDGQNVIIRDYSKLVPFLKAGESSVAVERFNETGELFDLKTEDVQLTIDAELQIELQKAMERYVAGGLDARKHINTDLVRMSVVVLDAKNGDLLASSVYPLPDYKRLEAENGKVYSDKGKKNDKEWTPYSDMDLGLRYPTHPGSTAKVMSAIAGVNELGHDRLDEVKYEIHGNQHTGLEPSSPLNMDLRNALVFSSNCYFINLVNEYNLYPGLKDIYGKTGISYKGIRPYTLTYTKYDSEWANSLVRDSESAVYTFRRYKEAYRKGELPRARKKLGWEMKWHANWLVAWGQGDLDATPLAMARVASTVANYGNMPVTRYLLTDTADYVHVSDSVDIALIRKYMIEEARVHTSKKMESGKVGGKTGTAEREYKGLRGGSVAMNDVWYVCFIDDANVSSKTIDGNFDVNRKSSLAVAVRIERLPAGNHSQYPKGFVKERLLPILEELGYGVFD